MVKKVLEFLDFGRRRNGKPVKFKTSIWRVVVKGGRRFAVARAPSSTPKKLIEAFRIIGKTA